MKTCQNVSSLQINTCIEWLEEDEDIAEEAVGQRGEKKRRLHSDQVRALEKSFEVENKLEPERKARLAQELGLQPRQVAIWFQNRRARWKTKQLERDYGDLKSKYDALRTDYDALVRDKDSLLDQVMNLKAKVGGGGEESFSSINEERIVSENEIKHIEEDAHPPLIYKDGSSDSGSSAILNDFNDQENGTLISFKMDHQVISSLSPPLLYHRVKVEEDDDEFLNEDGPCSSTFFHDEQAHMLSWYCGEGWD